MSFQQYNNFNNVDLTKYFEDIDFDDVNNSKDTKVNNYVEKRVGTKIVPSCGTCKDSEILNDYSHGIIVCTNCGQVLDSILDYNPEWKQYDDDDKNNSRCGMPINALLPQSSLGTNIVGVNPHSRLKILHNWNAMPYKERSLNYVFKAMHEKCGQHGILKCIEDDAKIMYKVVSECKHIKGKNKGKYVITRGKNRLSIIAACIFFACRRKNLTRTPREIADIFGIKHLEMNKGCKNFLKFLKIKKFNMNMGTSNAEHFIKRFCNMLHLKNLYAEKALKIVRNVNKLNIASVHTPYSLATSCILLMAEINKLSSITKKKLSKRFDVSEVTINKAYKKIKQYKDIVDNDTATCMISQKIEALSKNYTISQEIYEKMKTFGISITDVDNAFNNASKLPNNTIKLPVSIIIKESNNSDKSENNDNEFEDELFNDLSDIDDTEYESESDVDDLIIPDYLETHDSNVVTDLINELTQELMSFDIMINNDFDYIAKSHSIVNQICMQNSKRCLDKIKEFV